LLVTALRIAVAAAAAAANNVCSTYFGGACHPKRCDSVDEDSAVDNQKNESSKNSKNPNVKPSLWIIFVYD